MSEDDHRKKIKHLSLFQDFDELEYLSEEHERTIPEKVLSEIQNHQDVGYFIQCPRCGVIQKNVVTPPYCLECNWDSLTDPCLIDIDNFTKGKKI